MIQKSDFLTRSPSELKALSEELGIPFERLKIYFDDRKLPRGKDGYSIAEHFGLNQAQLSVIWGQPDDRTMAFLQDNLDLLKDVKTSGTTIEPLNQTFQTASGTLYRNDCLDVLSTMDDNSVNLVFADPPFNLNKEYPSRMNDKIKEEEYIAWMNRWIGECCRVLKPGGSFFLWNLPKWNSEITSLLNRSLTFRHWITVDLKYGLPVPGRLYPSHYSLLYYCKGLRPATFKPDRVPMQICPNCYIDLKDYGGYKSKMNPKGVNISDVWTDIPPVRHAKYKRRKNSNELSIKLLDRIIEMSSEEGDLIFDPFGGSGTTYAVAEMKNRKWIGTDIGPSDEIIERFAILDTEREILEKYRKDLNYLFTKESAAERKKRKLWTDESFR